MLGRQPSSRWVLLGLIVAGALIVAVSIALASGTKHGTASNSTTTSKPVSVMPAQLLRPRTPGKVLFASDFERGGFPEWYVQALPGRARLVHGSPYEGHENARFEVRPGDVEPDTGSQRAEVTGPTFHEGQDLYVRLAIRIPKANTFRGPWQIVQQFHEFNWSGSPGTAVQLTDRRRLRVGAGDSSPVDWTGPRLRTGQWHELVYRVKFSQDPKVGLVEVWLDGRHQRLRNGHFRAYGQTMYRPHVFLKTGIYRSRYSTGTSLVEDDSVIVVQRPH